ncbi:MAG: SIMPL domain-containing protein, partial [bacterium]|nr:SIMPL domain-containing protein [bacterium]
VGVFVFVYAGYYASLWKQIKRSDREPFQISVSGEGKIAAKPDVAMLSATVRTEKTALKDAQKENSETSQKVVNFLKSSGVAEKDIRTSYYNISPQYQYNDCSRVQIEIYPPRPCLPLDKPRIVGYQIMNVYEIKVRDLEKAGEVLEGVVSAGANEVSGLSFMIDDEDALRADARKEAIDDARAKAKILAKQLGVRLGRIVSFSEGGQSPPIFYERGLAVAEAGKGGDTAVPVPVEAGEQEILVSVTIVYEMK